MYIRHLGPWLTPQKNLKMKMSKFEGVLEASVMAPLAYLVTEYAALVQEKTSKREHGVFNMLAAETRAVERAGERTVLRKQKS